MITSSEIYWILQLDTFKTAINVFSFTYFIIFLMFLILYPLVSSLMKSELDLDSKLTIDTINRRDSKVWKIFYYYCMLTIFIVPLNIANCFIPSTKNMVIIKIVPMLNNSELIQNLPKDIKDFYDLGIQAIKEKIQKEMKIEDEDK